jgi:hypothetical protein
MDLIATADTIAAAAHAGQLDKAGKPYVGHVRGAGPPPLDRPLRPARWLR